MDPSNLNYSESYYSFIGPISRTICLLKGYSPQHCFISVALKSSIRLILFSYWKGLKRQMGPCFESLRRQHFPPSLFVGCISTPVRRTNMAMGTKTCQPANQHFTTDKVTCVLSGNSSWHSGLIVPLTLQNTCPSHKRCVPVCVHACVHTHTTLCLESTPASPAS